MSMGPRTDLRDPLRRQKPHRASLTGRTIKRIGVRRVWPVSKETITTEKIVTLTDPKRRGCATPLGDT